PYSINDNTRVGFSVTNSSGISLDPAQPVAQLWLRAMLADTTDFHVSLDSVLLNNGDASFSNCTLATAGSRTTATLATGCGDSVLLQRLQGKALLFMMLPRPNPAANAVTIGFINPTNASISYSVIDALGKIRIHGISNEKGLTLDLSELPEGVYFIRAFIPGLTSVSQKFLIVR
ncbi:MAG: T9SS type A sorting domain-containing protein, partial [Candidatus Kapaibacterium sp.]